MSHPTRLSAARSHTIATERELSHCIGHNYPGGGRASQMPAPRRAQSRRRKLSGSSRNARVMRTCSTSAYATGAITPSSSSRMSASGQRHEDRRVGGDHELAVLGHAVAQDGEQGERRGSATAGSRARRGSRARAAPAAAAAGAGSSPRASARPASAPYRRVSAARSLAAAPTASRCPHEPSGREARSSSSIARRPAISPPTRSVKPNTSSARRKSVARGWRARAKRNPRANARAPASVGSRSRSRPPTATAPAPAARPSRRVDLPQPFSPTRKVTGARKSRRSRSRKSGSVKGNCAGSRAARGAADAGQEEPGPRRGLAGARPLHAARLAQLGPISAARE